MHISALVFLLSLIAAILLPQSVAAQRGGEVTVTISPGPTIKAELPYYVASGDLRLHFNNTTSRHAKITSLELLFVDQLDRKTTCENFFGNTIGAASRRYDLRNLSVLPGKQATVTAKMLPPEKEDNYRVEPGFHDERTQRYTFIACYKFNFENDDRELEVYQLAGRWVFERKTGKLISRNVPGKAELLPR